jgi:hypothetical protein
MTDDRAERRGVGVNNEGYVEFGPSRLQYVPLTLIGVLEQNRQTYPPEHIRELADSMVIQEEDGVVEFEMIHQTTIARLHREAAEAYLSDHNEHYGVNHTIDDLEADSEGAYHILIAGHCRRLAIYLNCRNYNIEPSRALVSMSPRDEITFEEALALQVRENYHLRTSPQDDASSILRYYQLRTRREGREPPLSDCAKVLGYSASKIRDALRFARLPGEVQEFARGEKPLLSYSVAVQLFAVYEAYLLYHFERNGNDVDAAAETATASVVGFAKGLVASVLHSRTTNSEAVIRGKLRELTDAPYVAEGLFEMGTEDYNGHNDNGGVNGRRMGHLAISALAYRHRHAEMTDSEEERVLEIAELIRRRRADRGEYDSKFVEK